MNPRIGLLALALVAVLAAIAVWKWPGGEADVAPEWTPPATGVEPIGPGAGYLRGAHWFGEGWAVNFWNTRLEERAAEDFATLRADGFNTVVLVVPWPGFSASPGEGRIDPERARRLESLLDLASEAGLNVVLRLGYAWDASVAQSGQWLTVLWLDEDVRQAWLRHMAAVWALVEDRPEVRFAFISWEDLWAVAGFGDGGPEKRLDLAWRTGFQDWLRRYVPLEVVNARYGASYTDFSQVPVAQRQHPAFGLFFDFIDHAWVERFFRPAQAAFPRMSMEVRIDSDPVWNAPGELAYWHSHELAWDLPGAEWITVYWAPAMGGENQGEMLSPETAAERLAYQMNRLRRVTGDRPIFIDQFLVEDFTPGFENNGRLPRDQVDDFLALAAPVLETLTHGYALWTWRDYLHNAVPSPDFSAAPEQWAGVGAAADGMTLSLEPGDRLWRDFTIHEFHAPGGPESALLCLDAVVDGDTAPDLLVETVSGELRSEIDVSGSGEACLDLPVEPVTTVALEALQPVALFSMSFSGFTQPTGIRDVDGQPKPVATAWRDLNAALVSADPAPFEAWEDGWMGKSLTARFRADPEEDTELVFRTHLPGAWPFEPELTVTVNGEVVGSAPCNDDGAQRMPVPGSALVNGLQELTLTVDRTWRPEGDERRLGCLVQGLELIER